MLLDFLKEGLSQAYLIEPTGLLAFGYITILLLIVTAEIVGNRAQLKSLSPAKKTFLLAGCLLIFIVGITGDLTPAIVTLPEHIAAIGITNFVIPVLPIIFALYAVIGSVLNRPAAVLAGLTFGAGVALWQTHSISDIFGPAVVAILIATMLGQNYAGLLYDLFRQPLVAVFSGALLQLFLIILGTYASSEAAEYSLLALDAGFVIASRMMPVLMVDALLGGLLATIVLQTTQKLHQKISYIPTFFSRTLYRNMVTAHLAIAGLVTIVLVVVAYHDARSQTINNAKSRLIYQVKGVSDELELYQLGQMSRLQQAGLQILTSATNPPTQAIAARRIAFLKDHYDRVLVYDSNSELIIKYPESLPDDLLANPGLEITDDGQAVIVYSEPQGENPGALNFYVPIRSEGIEVGVCVGQVFEEKFSAIVFESLEQITQDDIRITNEQGTLLIGKPGPGTAELSQSPIDSIGEAIASTTLFTPIDTLGGDQWQSELTYSLQPSGLNWIVVGSVPMKDIVEETLVRLSVPLLLLTTIIIATTLIVVQVSRKITKPLTELQIASQQLDEGNLNYSIETIGSNEIKRLSQSILQMQVSIRRQRLLQELLIETSQKVIGSFDLNKGVPDILMAAIRGTGANSARCLIYRGQQGKPLVYTEGVNEGALERLDNPIKQLLQQAPELILYPAVQVKKALHVNDNTPLPKGLAAVRIDTGNTFWGVLWVVFNTDTIPGPNTLEFLQALGAQMGMLLKNAKLFASVEGDRRHLSAVLRNASDAVIVTDVKGRLSLINGVAESYLGLEAKRDIGKPLSQTVASQSLINAFAQRNKRSNYVEITTPEDRFIVGAVSSLANYKGQFMGMAAVLHDATHFKSLLKVNMDVLTTLSHDLKGTLTYINTYSELISVGADLSPEQEDWLVKIRAGVNQIEKLISGLLDLRRLEHEDALIISKIDAASLLERSVEECQAELETAGIDVKIDIDSRVPVINGDELFLRQSIKNLIQNATLYAVGSDRIDLKATTNLGKVIISVTDYGPGIPKNEQERLFELFYRTSSAMGSRLKGTGLGLSLVKAIVERHGGQAWCQSEIGKGASFFISLPAEASCHQSGHQEQEEFVGGLKESAVGAPQLS